MSNRNCPADVGTDTIDALIKEVEALRKAKVLLEKVWLNIDPERTRYDIQDYFGHDDSE